MDSEKEPKKFDPSKIKFAALVRTRAEMERARDEQKQWELEREKLKNQEQNRKDQVKK